MGNDVGGDVHAGTVFPLDDRALLTDGLNTVEEAVPDTDTGKCQCADLGALHVYEDIVYDDRYDAGNDDCHREYFPVAFIDEDAEQFSQVDPDLSEPFNMPYGLLILFRKTRHVLFPPSVCLLQTVQSDHRHGLRRLPPWY